MEIYQYQIYQCYCHSYSLVYNIFNMMAFKKRKINHIQIFEKSSVPYLLILLRKNSIEKCFKAFFLRKFENIQRTCQAITELPQFQFARTPMLGYIYTRSNSCCISQRKMKWKIRFASGQYIPVYTLNTLIWCIGCNEYEYLRYLSLYYSSYFANENILAW